jgi:predicted RNase H-like HicB family nuclease
MLSDYLRRAMHKAHFEILPDDHAYFGEIAGFEGVNATAETLEKCREELMEVLEEWILIRVARNLPLPVVDGIELAVKNVSDAAP